MMNATGSHSIANLSSKDFELTRQSRAFAPGRRQLLTGEPRPLPFAIAFRNGERVEVTLIGSGEEPSSHWRVFAALQTLAGLGPNWDSYGALPLSPRAVRRSVGLLASILPGSAPEPTVVPTRDGGVQFEWHRRGIDVEVTVPPLGDISFFIKDQEGDGIPERSLLDEAFAAMNGL